MDQKQEEIYRAILEHIVQNHYPPTVRELCTQCSITSTSVMQKRLKKAVETYLREGTEKEGEQSFACAVTISYVVKGEPAEWIQRLVLYGTKEDWQEQLAIVQETGHAAIDGKNGGCQIECKPVLVEEENRK